jgi:hypothetical protein
MNKNFVEIENNKIVVIGKKSNIIVRIILWFLAIVFFLIPLSVTITQIVLGNGFHIAFIITFFIFWGMAVLMTRIVIWNTFGKEILHLHEKTIDYIADYKYFKGGERTFNVNETIFETTEFLELRNKKMWTLSLTTNNEVFQTVLKLDEDEYEKINKELKTRYNKGCKQCGGCDDIESAEPALERP